MKKNNSLNIFMILLLAIYSYFVWKWGINGDPHGFLLMGIFFLSLSLIVFFIIFYFFYKFYRKEYSNPFLLYALVVFIILIIVYLWRASDGYSAGNVGELLFLIK